MVVAVVVMCVCAATGVSTALTMMDAMRLLRRDADADETKKKQSHHSFLATKRARRRTVAKAKVVVVA